LGVFHLSPVSAWVWSVLGNAVPPALLLLILEPFSKFLGNHSKIFKKCLDWWFKHVKNKFQREYLRWGMIGLTIFVAIPLPATGAWSGAVAAYLFGIPPREAFFFILLGVMIAGVIVTGATLGIFSIF
jgi:uncharacterized membrane protein